MQMHPETRYTIEDVVDYFLSKESMTPKKLQRLLYYAYCWTLTLLNGSVDQIHYKLFDDPIEAWMYGPVVPNIYYKYFRLSDPLQIPSRKNFDESVFPPEVLDVLNQVWEEYGWCSAELLDSFSRSEDPWIKARHGIPFYMPYREQISDRVIFEYFTKQMAGE